MMGPVNRGALCATLIAVAACAAPRDEAQIDPALEQYVLDRVPASIEHRHFLDFGGKVHVLGYDLDLTGPAEPGSVLNLKLYWKCVDDLEPGWGLFTHLINEYGHRIANYDNEGPLRTLRESDKRQALPPSSWEPGKVYVDEQRIGIPRYEQAAPWQQNVTSTLTLVTGVWKDATRLEVLSGPSDGENAGIVAHLHTGVERPKAPAGAALGATSSRSEHRK